MLINQNELYKWLGFNQSIALKRCLDRNQIGYIIGKGGQICTTLDAVNAALGLSENNLDDIKIEF